MMTSVILVVAQLIQSEPQSKKINFLKEKENYKIKKDTCNKPLVRGLIHSMPLGL